MPEKNDLLIYTIETLIQKGTNQTNNLTQLHLYKLIYLAHLNLKEKHINIHLPYSWYLYGTIIEPQGFYRSTGIHLANYILENNTVDNLHTDTENLTLTQKEQTEIDMTIDTLLNKYIINRKINLNALLKDTYQTAPTQFQRTYKYKLIPEIADDINKETILTILNELKNEFPKEKYPDAYTRFLRIDNIIQLAFEVNADKKDIKDLIKIYWTYFAAVLRTRENENLTPDEIEQLEIIAEKKQELYDIQTFDYDEKYTLQLPPIDINTLTDVERELLRDISKIAYEACISERK